MPEESVLTIAEFWTSLVKVSQVSEHNSGSKYAMVTQGCGIA